MMLGQNARTPPPKRWKRSFDMAHPNAPQPRKDNGVNHEQPLSLVSKNSAHPAKIDLNKKRLPKKKTIQNFNIDAQGFRKTRNKNPPTQEIGVTS